MRSNTARHRCKWLSLLTLTAAGCATIIYISVTYTGKLLNAGIARPNYAESEKLKDEKCIPVCNSKECVSFANMLLTKMNPAIDPCEHFASFLCGEFIEKFGADEKGSALSLTTNLLQNKLKSIVENLQAEPGSASDKMKIMYDSCLNKDSSELKGTEDFMKMLDELGMVNWPSLATDFRFTKSILPSIFGILKAYGDLDYFDIEINDIKTNESESEIVEKQVKVSFRSFLFNINSYIPYEAGLHILEYFDQLEANDTETILKDHEDVRKFVLDEKIPDCDDDNCTEKKIDCSMHKDDDWNFICEAVEAFINVTNLSDYINRLTITFDENEEDFLKNFFPRLNSLSDRSVANFLSLNALLKYLGELNFYFRLTKLKYVRTEWHSPMTMDRWKYCLTWVSEHMRIALQNEFMLHHIGPKVFEEVLEVYDDYRSYVADKIVLQEWISSDQRLLIEDIIRNLSLNIFHLRQLPNTTYANAMLKEFHPIRESFFKNVLDLKKATWHGFLAHKIENRVMHATRFEVEASTGGDMIDLHYGMFFPPFHLRGLKSEINRNLLISILGHEIGHNILFILRKYFSSGDDILNTTEHKAAHEETHTAYTAKKDCIVKQFSEFEFDILKENLDGYRYYIENFSDNVGVAVFDEFIEKYQSTDDEIMLPGLRYTTKQLLYMSSSQIWCSKSDREEEIHYKITNSHAPPQARLLGMLQNSKGYASAFKCPEGSYMNPTTKCSFLENV